ncbi:MAG: response regulator, partial [Nitrospinaceae bacterium]|nr:response regulator transcription factor [Nitrospinaceae bacterium]NIR54932.1 response regulator transcription factor [Nitrospinaceae bacterium]NIS85360.1 response regulator transcription factor [Nitrospinaceae bacterium]NIT82174.1 response regulator transcription factor [Nitrospinaceae bacterium]NIU44428.1 response regulator transcription factor [Nitrospinaceae bacterium]
MNESRSNEKIKVLIADDHAVVRQGLRQILSRNADLEVAVEAGDGREMMDHLRKTRVDVVLMDLEMPGKNGWDILVDLKHHYPKLPVIILSVHPEDQYGVRCLKRGAGGYLAKTSAPEQLVDAVRKVARGGKFVTPELAEKLLTDWDQKTGP